MNGYVTLGSHQATNKQNFAYEVNDWKVQLVILIRTLCKKTAKYKRSETHRESTRDLRLGDDGVY